MNGFDATKPTEYALNLCDIFARESCAPERLIDNVCFDIDRIYIGSYFCDHYFLQTPEHIYRSFLGFAKDNGIKVTLVVPPIFQANIGAAFERIYRVTESSAVDELTVNEWGMCEDLYDKTKLRLNAGRLLQKDNRDPRYADYFDTTYTSRSFSPFYRGFFSEQHISGIEIDCTHREIFIPKESEGYFVSVHGPFCYMTIGSICEFASMNKDEYHKFRYADRCACDCNRAAILCHTEQGIELARIGRSVQFENKECKIVSEVPFRFVESPIRATGVLSR